MSVLIVIENPRRWPLEIEGAEVISARSYLTDPAFSERRRALVVNMCRTYAYQSTGYYVSLLAEARGHRTLPSVATLQDLRLSPLIRIVSDGLDKLIQQQLKPLKSDDFELSIYFGRNLATRYDRLSQAIFNQFPAPFLQASFARSSRWMLTGVRMLAASDIPDPHRNFVMERAAAYFTRPRRAPSPRKYRYDLAILLGDEPEPPSDSAAIDHFIRAARELEMDAITIGRDDYGRIGEFDALFIRETTAVNHHTYRFARRAAAQGLVVIDDPQSIVRCTNKVYQAELFLRMGIPRPPTAVIQNDTVESIVARIGLPAVLKEPDSAFSRGVVKVTDTDQLRRHLDRMLEASELVIAQGYVRSEFDWRIGILDGKVLFACRYYLAPGDWRIINTEAKGTRRYGGVDSVPLDQVPPRVLDAALGGAREVGSGLYGVDVKEVDGEPFVMEINDNPTIEAGSEDGVAGRLLYAEIMGYFRRRLDARGSRGGEP